MNYSDVKLGLIGRLRVWNERRIAEKIRKEYGKNEGELVEVEYSDADKLEKELLEKKKIKKATKDAAKFYRIAYGKDDDGVGEADFIEQYLTDNGLKPKVPSYSSHDKTHKFMEQYSVEKSPEELNYERNNANNSRNINIKEEKVK